MNFSLRAKLAGVGCAVVWAIFVVNAPAPVVQVVNAGLAGWLVGGLIIKLMINLSEDK